MLFGCTEESKIHEVYQNLKKEYEITCLGEVKHFLGYEIRFEKGQYGICLTNYIENIVHRVGMSDAQPSQTPINPDYTVASGESKLLQNVTLYRSLVGALLYVAVNARPDIAVSVGLLERKVSAPTEMNWMADKRVIRYLKGTKNFKLRFGPGDGWKLTGYSDSDWGGDRSNGRSTTEYIFFYGGGPIAWMSKRQT